MEIEEKPDSLIRKSGSGVIACGIALIRRVPTGRQAGAEFLISQRCEDDTFGSFWEFPGGKKDADETFEQCCVRESKEELGVVIQVQEKFMEIKKEYNEKIIWLNFYLCAYVCGQPKPIECQKVLWAPVENLTHFKFPPANELVIDKLKARFL